MRFERRVTDMCLHELLRSFSKKSPIPLYYQLKSELLRQIKSGELQAGDMIPSEAEFCEILGISRPTVRQALSELVSEGYLSRQKGRGTFVTRPKIDGRFFQKLESFNREMLQKGLTPSTQVLQFEVQPATPDICLRLNIPEGGKAIYLKRLRFADGEPLVLLETYLPYVPFAGLLKEDLERDSLYALLEERYGACVTRVFREMEAVNATPSEAHLLKITRNQAICLVHTIAYTREETAVEYSVARYRGDRNRFSVELYREPETERSL